GHLFLFAFPVQWLALSHVNRTIYIHIAAKRHSRQSSFAQKWILDLFYSLVSRLFAVGAMGGSGTVEPDFGSYRQLRAVDGCSSHSVCAFWHMEGFKRPHCSIDSPRG